MKNMKLTEELVKSTFGTSPKVPSSYVERNGIDDKFKEAIKEHTHIIIHGSSKQGKTSLWKRHVPEDKLLHISCGTIDTLSDLHEQILKSAGYRVTATRTNTTSPSLCASFSFPFIDVKGKVGMDITSETASHEIQINTSDANDIIRALKAVKYSGHIVLDDFHYLPENTQRAFSHSLKTFYDRYSDVSFIIVGVWKEANRLESYNGDLSSRIITIDADNWTDSDLKKVISTGQTLLNVRFDEKFQDELVKRSEGTVYLLQEACKAACISFIRTHAHPTGHVTGDAEKLIADAIKSEQGRCETFITDFCRGKKETEYGVSRWTLISLILAAIKCNKTVIRRSQITTLLAELHPMSHGSKPINNGLITQALTSTSKRQLSIGARPPVLSYDKTTRQLHIVDHAFAMWLQHVDHTVLTEALSLDSDTEGDIDYLLEVCSL